MAVPTMEESALCSQLIERVKDYRVFFDSSMKWNDDKTITITPPAKPKKITGTRFAAIMGLNKWTSPFNAWCAITRTYEEPFLLYPIL